MSDISLYWVREDLLLLQTRHLLSVISGKQWNVGVWIITATDWETTCFLLTWMKMFPLEEKEFLEKSTSEIYTNCIIKQDWGFVSFLINIFKILEYKSSRRYKTNTGASLRSLLDLPDWRFASIPSLDWHFEAQVHSSATHPSFETKALHYLRSAWGFLSSKSKDPMTTY